jgi:chemotaxis protein MotB
MAMRRNGSRSPADIWPGFVDAMTGLLMVLTFVLTIFMVVQYVLRETISGQDKQLDVLSGEVAALAQALGLEQRRSADLTTRVGELDATLTGLRAEGDAQRARISVLTAERDATQAGLAAAETRITSFEAQVAALIASRDQALGRVATLKTTEAQLLSEQQALDLALAQARSEIDAGTEAARLAAARREALEALIADLRTRQDDLAATNAATAAALADTQTRLTDEEAARLAEAAAAAVLRQRLQDADTELTALTLSLEAERARAEDTLTLLAAAETARDDLTARLAGAVLARDGTAAQVADLRAALDAAAQARMMSERQAQDALAAALAARLAAEAEATAQLTAAQQRAALLAAARTELAAEAAKSTEAARASTLLNQQVAALRAQLGQLQALLDDYQVRDSAAQVQMQSLGSDLNAALARAATEERRRRELEQAEVARLEAERQRLEAEAQDLQTYRSEFFGRMRAILGDQDGVRIVGDRFVFSSEVLFPQGSAELSDAGRGEVAKVAEILRRIADDIPPGIDWIIRVDGHTDDLPLSGLGEFRDNWELSQARALSVVRTMSNDLGIPPNRLAANGFGEYQPINPEATPAARAQNRRIELKLTER